LSEQQENNKQAPVHYERGVPVLDVKSEEERKRSEAEAHDKRYKDDQITLNRRLVNTTIALAIATIVLGIASGFQLWYMHRQWKLGSDGLSKTGDQVWAAKDAAFAARQAANTSNNILGESKRQFDKTLKQMEGQTAGIEESNRLNRDALTSVQRAFVTFQAMQLDTPPVSMNPRTIAWVFSGVVENSGATPAINKIEHFAGSNKLHEEPSEAQFIGDEQDRPVGEIGPKVTKRVGQIVKEDDYVLGGYTLLQIGDEAFHRYLASHDVFFWGWVAYRDVFPNTRPHVTEFCQHVIGVAALSTPQGPIPKLEFSECRGHSCVDENCPDYKAISALVPK